MAGMAELGLRAHLGSVFIDRGDAAAARVQREAVIREVEERESLGPRLRVALAPHAIYTVGNESLEWLAGLARKHDLLLHIHLSETEGEVEACVAKHGIRPAFLLDRLAGLLDARGRVHAPDRARGLVGGE